MRCLGLLSRGEMIVDGVSVTIWRSKINPALLAMFAILSEYIYRGNLYDLHANERSKPLMS